MGLPGYPAWFSMIQTTSGGNNKKTHQLSWHEKFQAETVANALPRRTWNEAARMISGWNWLKHLEISGDVKHTAAYVLETWWSLLLASWKPPVSWPWDIHIYIYGLHGMTQGISKLCNLRSSTEVCCSQSNIFAIFAVHQIFVGHDPHGPHGFKNSINSASNWEKAIIKLQG